ncbi:MAG: dihydroorotase [Oscillospiraceae bacterium]|nr:dihydroorotase [Oscillospiraceae bacterium]
MGILFQNGVLVNPDGLSGKMDVLCEDGMIAAIAPQLPAKDHRVIDAAGKTILPGLVDVHVHLRDPGLTEKEDIATGTSAAAAGGVTTLLCMPNTRPVCDSVETVSYIMDKAASVGSARVLPIAAVTVGQHGQALTDFSALRRAGAAAFSDDGVPVMNAAVMRAALLAAKAMDAVVIAHEEDGFMVGNRACNEGKISEKLGIPGRPSIAEDIMVMRDVMLAEETGARVHIAHVSTKGAAEIIRKAKARGIAVTAETCPQYFMMTENLLLEKGTMARVNPPLRTETDRRAILEAVCDGTIDCIVTDHAPHCAAEKARPLTQAPSGMVGLETSFAACVSALVQPGLMTLEALAAKMSTIPAALFGLDAGTLRVGGRADLVLVDPQEQWVVDPAAFRSKARNTPFGGMRLTGRVKMTLCGGKITFQDL